MAADFLIPLAFAGILAMLMAPLCGKLEAKGFHKAVASFVCILLLILFSAGIGTLLSTQIASISNDLPTIEKSLNGKLESTQQWVQNKFGISPQEQQKAVQGNSSGIGSVLGGFLRSFTGVLSNSVLVFVYLFLLLYYRSRFPKFIMKVVSDEQKDQAHNIIIESSQVAQQYLIGRGILIVVLGILYSIGLNLVGLENAIFLSFIAALLSIIPYVGNIISVAILLAMALAQDGGSSLYIGIVLVFTLTQFIESYLLEPFIVGAKVDIHPFFTVVIIIVGELIWGVAGMILAIPLLGMIKIVFSHIESLEPYAYLIGDTRKNDKDNTTKKIKDWLGFVK